MNSLLEAWWTVPPIVTLCFGIGIGGYVALLLMKLGDWLDEREERRAETPGRWTYP